MDKIEAILLSNIENNPKKEFNVIICTPIETPLKANKGWVELMDGIYSAKLTGEIIKKLADNNDVLSIEADTEIKIM